MKKTIFLILFGVALALSVTHCEAIGDWLVNSIDQQVNH